MPFTFKLSKRLALMKASLVPAAAAVLATCQLQDRRGITDPTLPSSSVVQVVVTPDTVTLEPQQTLQFRAHGRTQAGDSVAIKASWSASNGAFSSSGLYTAATVEGDYLVTAKLVQPSAAGVPGATGALSSTATNDGTSTVHVRRSGLFAQVAISPPSAGVGAGATVSASGLVTGLAVGSATITATSEGQSGTAAVTVSNLPVASVAVSPTAPNVYVGGAVQLTATLKDASGNPLSGRTVTWTTSNGAVATVSASGLVTGLAVGSTTITATSEGQSGTAAVTVSTVPVASVVVSPAAANVYVGGAVQLTTTPKDAAGNVLVGRAVTWASSNPAIATVSASGLVTGLAVGSTTITATSEGQSGTAAVTVSNLPVASVAVSPTAPNVYVGGAVQLTATLQDASGQPLSRRTVTWTTSSSAVAMVSASGLVTGVAVGAATITAASEGQSGTAAVTVSTVPVAAVVVSPATANVVVGGTAQLSATPKDAAGNVLAGRAVAWTSSNPGIATVSASGLVTGVAPGTATITATSEGQSGSATITEPKRPLPNFSQNPTS